MAETPVSPKEDVIDLTDVVENQPQAQETAADPEFLLDDPDAELLGDEEALFVDEVHDPSELQGDDRFVTPTTVVEDSEFVLFDEDEVTASAAVVIEEMPQALPDEAADEDLFPEGKEDQMRPPGAAEEDEFLFLFDETDSGDAAASSATSAADAAQSVEVESALVDPDVREGEPAQQEDELDFELNKLGDLLTGLEEEADSGSEELFAGMGEPAPSPDSEPDDLLTAQPEAGMGREPKELSLPLIPSAGAARREEGDLARALAELQAQVAHIQEEMVRQHQFEAFTERVLQEVSTRLEGMVPREAARVLREELAQLAEEFAEKLTGR